MSAPQTRWSLIAAWFTLTCLTVFVLDLSVIHSGQMLLAVGIVPPAMLLWLGTEERPLPIGSLSQGRRP